MDYTNIPESMRKAKQWLCYKLVDTGKPRLGKPPCSPKTGEICAKNDETMFCTLREALIGAERFSLDGIGFVFINDYIGIDLDDCFEEDDSLSPVAQDIFDHFSETYWEYSPSGNGLHAFLRGKKPNPRTKDTASHIEVYSDYNFVTVTGDRLDASGIEAVDQQTQLEWLFDKYLPELVTKTSDIIADHGEKSPKEWLELGLSKDTRLSELYNDTSHENDESSSDMSLLMKLAFWLNKDEAEITAAFMESPYCRSKDAAHLKKLKRKDYLPDTTQKAINLCGDTAAQSDARYKDRSVRFLSLTPQADGTDTFPLENYTDLGNAELMGEVFGDVLRYTPEYGWCFYQNGKWETDVDWRAMECARTIVSAMLESAEAWTEKVKDTLEASGEDLNSDEAKAQLAAPTALYKHAMKSQSERGMSAMVKLNKAFMVESADKFDADPWLLNTPECVIDLRTGEHMPHDAHYLMTHMTAASPAPGETPLFDAFLDKICCGDASLETFIQLVLGSALIGKVYSENLIIANGTGANGKSTLFNTMQALLGDYATSVNPDLLMSSRERDQRFGSVILKGKRLAVAQETEEGQRLQASMLKRLVSTDKIIGEVKFKMAQAFVPSHTLVLSTNHLPKIASIDQGTWRRIVVLPFKAVFGPDETVTDYHNILIEREGPQILDWAVKGAVRFFEMGCSVAEKPQAVKDASQEYREEEDWIAAFLSDCCTEEDGFVVAHADLYHAYNMWARDCGERPRTSIAFSKALASAGVKGQQKYTIPGRKTTCKVWFGYNINKRGSDTIAILPQKTQKSQETA